MSESWVSVDSLIYEAVQRNFRNAVVRQIRAGLVRTKGADWAAAVRSCMTGEEWGRANASASSAQASGELGRGPVDDADLLGVNHFYNIFDRYFDSIVPEASRSSSDLDKVTKKVLLANFKSIKDIRDPLSHPPEDSIAPFDALNIVYKLIHTMKILQMQGATEYKQIVNIQGELLKRAAGNGEGPTGSITPLSTLPPREEVYEQFVGRTTELEELWKWLADESSARWVLVGEGGKGKTTIAYQFADIVRSSRVSGINAVLWMSAKRRRFDEGSAAVIRTPDFFDLESALDKILIDFGWSNLISKSIDVKIWETKQLLTELPSLVVVDDLDSIDSENEDVVEFLTYDAPRTGSKILLTSRRLYFGMRRSSTIVKGLPKEDAVAFLAMMSEKMGINSSALQRHFPEIIQVTEGSPLYMEDLLRLCRSLPADKAILKWKQNAGDASRRYALEREIEMLSPTATSVLNACCLARAALTIAQLERIVGTSEDELLEAMDQLEKAYLVPGSVLVDGEPTFRVGDNLAWLVRRQLTESPSNQTLRAAVENVVGGASRRSGGVVDDHVRQIRVLTYSDRAGQAVEAAERFALEPGFAGEPSFLSAFAHAYASIDPPRVADARENWLRAAQLGLSNVESYVQWCLFEDSQEDWGRLLAAAELGIANCRSDQYKLLQFAGYASTRIAKWHARSQNSVSAKSSLDRADRFFRDALDSAARSNASASFVSKIYRGLVLAAQERKDPNKMNSWIQEWVKKMPKDFAAIEEQRRFRERFPTID